MTQTPRDWRTDLKATPKGSVLDYWLGEYAEVESRMKCLEGEVNRLKEALKEAKGDFEYIQSWQGLPVTLQTWVKTAIRARDEELKEGAKVI
ncbi:hypothetical protein [Paenibacillus graminis]|uniref:hypothetical protein n=1 Tax=Paenibacillus graminis TaxID=189425 RepID=UPI002DB65C35|nr:hypothetical protein [Paenibacillus graminis]MEC0169746.1 hypothetical protein [Paenibacillus graminis]